MKVLHCPTTTGGNPQGLARAERCVGLYSQSVAYQQNYLGYRADRFLWNNEPNVFRKQIATWRLLLEAKLHSDVVHYNSGTSILPWTFSENWATNGSLKWQLYSVYSYLCRLVEQHTLKRKVIAVTFQGDDARQGDYCLDHFEISIAHSVGDFYYTRASDERARQRIRLFDRYADLIYSTNPDLMWVLPERAKFVPYAHFNPYEVTPIYNKSNKRPVLLHAPSHRGAKGTKYILDAVDRLKSDGVSFDFKLVENLSNEEALKLYKKADLIVDQLLAGWYGGFAVEAMALGKPVICYLREDDLRFVPPKMRSELPLINANPKNIYLILGTWLTHRRLQLPDVGLKSRAFVQTWHDPVKIAASIKDDYQKVAECKLSFNCRRS